MTNINRYLLALFGMFFIVGVAQARVCFLPGGEDEAEFCLDSVPPEKSKCPGYFSCEHPKSSSEVCYEDDGSAKYADASSCCENPREYELCTSGAVCESGFACSASGYESCEKGHCVCPQQYKICDTENGQIGLGDPCTDADGVKYLECQCNNEIYHVCDSAATGLGSSCKDDRGTLYTQCQCPTNWVSSTSDCLCGVENECTNIPGTSKVYSCRVNNPPTCRCGYTYKASYPGCAEGCTDGQYEFIGEVPPGYICDEVNGLNGGVCGKNCKCGPQNWDIDICPYPDCYKLGYTETTCPADWLACPFDASKKKCIGGGDEEDDEPKGCPENSVEDGNSCYDCVANKDRLEGSMTSGTKTFLGACYNTSLCGNRYQYFGTGNNSAPFCRTLVDCMHQSESIPEKGCCHQTLCHQIESAYKNAREKHDRLCPQHKVKTQYEFNCDSYIPVPDLVTGSANGLAKCPEEGEICPQYRTTL